MCHTSTNHATHACHCCPPGLLQLALGDGNGVQAGVSAAPRPTGHVGLHEQHGLALQGSENGKLHRKLHGTEAKYMERGGA